MLRLYIHCTVVTTAASEAAGLDNRGRELSFKVPVQIYSREFATSYSSNSSSIYVRNSKVIFIFLDYYSYTLYSNL